MLKSIPVPTFRNAVAYLHHLKIFTRATSFLEQYTRLLDHLHVGILNGLPVPQHITNFLRFALLL